MEHITNKKMKIAFFGTSDRSIPILEILKENFSLKLVVTKKDRHVGRKQVLTETAAKTWAKQNKINYVEIDNLRDDDLDKVIKEVIDQEIFFGIVADFAYIIPQKLINIFNKKLINIHFSLLPKYRGASPVQHAILNGDDVTGITYQLISKQLDAGDIVSQIGYRVNHSETSGDLYETLFEISASNLPKVLNDFSKNLVKPMPQNEENATYTFSKTHPKTTYVYKEDALINWRDDIEFIERQIRAYNPWPIAWTYVKDLEQAECIFEGKIDFRESVDKELIIKIYKAEIIKDRLKINELQVEGKNKMTWDEFKNGYLA